MLLGIYLFARLLGWMMWGMLFIFVEAIVFEVLMVVGLVWLTYAPFYAYRHGRAPRFPYRPKARRAGRHVIWI